MKKTGVLLMLAALLLFAKAQETPSMVCVYADWEACKGKSTDCCNQARLFNLLPQEDPLAEVTALSFGLKWPAIPEKGLSSCFGSRKGGFHHGIDLPMSVGNQVKASKGGVVKHATEIGSCGNAVVIDHGRGVETTYCHLSKFNVFKGQSVNQGDVIGFSGGMPGSQGAGTTTGPHLHFAVEYNDAFKNPLCWLPRMSDGITKRCQVAPYLSC